MADTVHGPQPRSYDYAFPRKKLLGALRSALAAKFADGKLIVVNAFDVKEPKTKEFRKALDALKVETDGAAGRSAEAREPQSGTELAQHRTGSNWCAGNEVHPYHLLRLRPRDLLAAGDREAAGFAEELGLEAAAQVGHGEDEGGEEADARAAAARAHEKAAEVA